MPVKKVGTGPLPSLPMVDEISLPTTGFMPTERVRAPRTLGAGDQGINLSSVENQQVAGIDAEFTRLTATLEARVRALIAKADALQASLDLTEVVFGDGVELLIRDFMAIIRDCDQKIRKMLLAEFLRRTLEQNRAADYENKRLGNERYQQEQLKSLVSRGAAIVNRTMQAAEKAQVVTGEDVKSVADSLNAQPKAWFQLGPKEPFADTQAVLRQLYLQTGKTGGVGPLPPPQPQTMRLHQELF